MQVCLYSGAMPQCRGEVYEPANVGADIIRPIKLAFIRRGETCRARNSYFCNRTFKTSKN